MEKRQWVAVNYETGEVLQVKTPCTCHEALKIFKEHQNNFKGFFILESFDKIEKI
jgi:hypothetical protein